MKRLLMLSGDAKAVVVAPVALTDIVSTAATRAIHILNQQGNWRASGIFVRYSIKRCSLADRSKTVDVNRNLNQKGNWRAVASCMRKCRRRNTSRIARGERQCR